MRLRSANEHEMHPVKRVVFVGALLAADGVLRVLEGVARLGRRRSRPSR